jgi:hypothetical protein
MDRLVTAKPQEATKQKAAHRMETNYGDVSRGR